MRIFAHSESESGQVKEIFSLEGESAQDVNHFFIGRALDYDCYEPMMFVSRDGKMAGWANWLHVWELNEMPIDEQSRDCWEVH